VGEREQKTVWKKDGTREGLRDESSGLLFALSAPFLRNKGKGPGKKGWSLARKDGRGNASRSPP